jgi:hypothetical protein
MSSSAVARMSSSAVSAWISRWTASSGPAAAARYRRAIADVYN